jgi:hypothetical protein
MLPLYELLLKLSISRSVANCKTMISDWAFSEGVIYADVKLLLERLTEEALKQHLQGIEASKLIRHKKEAIYKPFPKPKFLPSSKSWGVCASCYHQFKKGNSDPKFFHNMGPNNIRLYCPVPTCFPKDHKEAMLADIKYMNWKKENVG